MNAKKAATEIQRAIRMDDVPAEKFGVMVQKTVVGIGFIALGVVGIARWSFPWWATVALCVLGATVWSGQLVTQSIRRLIPLTRAVTDVVRGKEPPADG